MSKSGADALALAGADERAPATNSARLSRMAAVAWTRPMKAPWPPPMRPMRSLRFRGGLVGMRGTPWMNEPQRHNGHREENTETAERKEKYGFFGGNGGQTSFNRRHPRPPRRAGIETRAAA